jgi:hypothetical protein
MERENDGGEGKGRVGAVRILCCHGAFWCSVTWSLFYGIRWKQGVFEGWRGCRSAIRSRDQRFGAEDFGSYVE